MIRCVECDVYLFRVIKARFRIDQYTISFFTLLGVVRSSVLVWSYYYIDVEKDYKRFLLLLFSFIVSITLLIFFSNLFISLIGWDLLGVTSFFLVIYYKNRKSLGSGMMTALSNRLGDCFLFCLLGYFICDGSLMNLSLLVLIRMTKSAQVPFSSWLPAAMAAPTPVRALVHSSTLVTAGVYVLIRYCNDCGWLLSVGRLTLFLAGIRACVERDLKKVVALRTLSQLGVIIVSLGCGKKSYCFFHLISHAFFKALLFLCVGLCIHTVYGSQDYRRIDKLSPIAVSVLCGVANLSLIGFLFTSGFYRKDMVLESITDGTQSWAVVLFILGIGFTACYSWKILIRSLLKEDSRVPVTISMGGLRWQAKGPLFGLAIPGVLFGSSVGNYTRGQCTVIGLLDKSMPLTAIILGFLFGYYLPRINRPTLMSIAILTPLAQLNAYGAVREQQKPIDKGWVESASLSLSVWTTSVHAHYTPATVLGLRGLILFYLLYA